MKVERLGAPLGARVHGLDVRTLSPGEFEKVVELFHSHHVLVFPEQELSPEEHMAFAERFGVLQRHPYAGLTEYPDVIELRNVGKKRDINQHWHSDMTYEPRPPKLTMLYAHAAPSIGGDTAFANQVLAYEALSDGLRVTLEPLHAVHSAEDLAATYRQDPGEAKRAEHPVVRTHDETGSRALYVCRAFTRRFVGWSREESAPLLQYLFEHAVRPEFQARQAWSAGDLAMWDNRSVQHFAVHDHADDEPRLIHRVQVV